MSPAARAGVITQARTTSTRLPGKVLRVVGGRTLLDHHLDRLGDAGLEVYLATTSNASDDAIQELADRRGVPCFRGSEHDVLGRYAGAVEAFGIDTVVRVTSDCPLIDGNLVREALDRHLASGDPWLYVSNGIQRTFPRGMDFEVFGADALLDAHRNAVDPVHREHVTPFLYLNGSGRVRVEHVRRADDASQFRLTVDTLEDFELVRVLVEEYGADDLDCDQLVHLLEIRPELAAINAAVEQKKLGE